MANPNNTPQERIRIFDREGVPVAEFRANVSRSFIVGEEGRAQFVYATRKTDVVNDDVLRPGNWLLVENSALPPWVGTLDLPYSWGTRNITVSAYTPEHVFAQRIGPLEEVIEGSAGRIFARIVTLLNSAEQTIIRPGKIWKSGKQREETLNPQPLSEYLKGIWERSGEDYTFVPSFTTDGRLRVLANWLSALGTETDAMLHEGKGGGNIEAVGTIMVEDGDITNSVLAYGDGETWESKPSITVDAKVSIGRYGLREHAEEYRSTTSVTTLAENARKYLADFKQPARTFTITALNVGDTYRYIRLGNVLQLQLQNVGFRASGLGYVGRVRILGMHIESASRNKVKLILREEL